jgi:succinylglutamic semialdehyde dehydrogenase
VTGKHPDMPEPFKGPVITEKQAVKLLESQAFLQSKGGRPLLEMKSSTQGIGFLSPGLMDVTGVEGLPDEENFGPFLQLIRPPNFIEAVKEANKTKFGLAAGLFSSNEEEYRYFYENVRAGIVNWNTQLTGASSAAPFGGVGCSGNHRPSAYYAVDYCAYPVASMETPKIVMPAHIHPGIEF